VDHELYVDKILEKFHQYFGPYPATYMTLDGMNPDVLELLTEIHTTFPPEKRKPFQRVSRTEISHRDRDFICKIMKMDPRDRPTVQQLLEDEWFRERDGEDGVDVHSAAPAAVATPATATTPATADTLTEG
jgi:casein kinase II subunit alpha